MTTEESYDELRAEVERLKANAVFGDKIVAEQHAELVKAWAEIHRLQDALEDALEDSAKEGRGNR